MDSAQGVVRIYYYAEPHAPIDHGLRASRGSPGAIPGHVITSPRTYPLKDTNIMYTYEESVLDAADDAGFLTSKDAKRILKAHNIPAIDAWIDLGDSATDASKLLEYLGY